MFLVPAGEDLAEPYLSHDPLGAVITQRAENVACAMYSWVVGSGHLAAASRSAELRKEIRSWMQMRANHIFHLLPSL